MGPIQCSSFTGGVLQVYQLDFSMRAVLQGTKTPGCCCRVRSTICCLQSRVLLGRQRSSPVPGSFCCLDLYF